MAMPQRKSDLPERDHNLIHQPHADNENVDPKREEAEFTKKLERDLRTDQYLEVHRSDIKALRAFRREFHLDRLNPEELDIYVIHPERNVAITRAFEKNGKIPHFSFLTETKAEAQMLKQKSGFEDVVKGVAERHREHADIVVVLDPTVRATEKLLKNVDEGGWLLCRMNMANNVRAMGKYKLMGVIESGSGSPSVNRNTEGLWAKAEIDSDNDLKNAKEEGAVTYQEALKAVEEAGFSTKNVFESYKDLIEEAKKQNSSRAENGETLLPCTITRDEKTVEVEVNTVLPLKEKEQNSENIAIFKKHEFV